MVKLSFNLKLPNNKVQEISLKPPKLRKFPYLLVDIANILTEVLTFLFFTLIFSSHIFRFSRFAEIDLVIFIYIFVILIAFLQFVRLFIGGDSFFPKFKFDVLILIIPPFLILPLIFKNNLAVGMFGTLESWVYAGISMLSVVLFCYITVLNFNNNEGFKKLKFYFDVGLLIGLILLFVRPDLATPDIDFIAVLFIPLNIYQFITSESLRAKISTFILTIFGILIVFTGKLFNLSYSGADWQFRHIIFLYFVVATLFIIYRLVTNRKKYFNFIAKLSNTRQIKFTQGQLKKFLKPLGIGLVYTGVLIWLLTTDFLQLILRNFFEVVSGYIQNLNVSQFLLGSKVSIAESNFIGVLDTYGIITCLLVFGTFIFLSFQLLKSLAKINKSNLFILIQLLLLITAAVFFELSIIVVFIIWVTICFALIQLREYEVNFDAIKLSEQKGETSNTVVNLVKTFLIIITFGGVILVISSLVQIIGQNLR